MDEKQLPDGFMFNPTDQELVGYFLRRKLCGKKLPSVVISEVDVYKFAPWDLPDMAGRIGDHQSKWHFFCPRSSKCHHSSSGRANRTTDIGFWKTTGKDRAVSCKNGVVVGMHKTLIFYRGRPPSGERTDWIMHEYRIDEQVPSSTPVKSKPTSRLPSSPLRWAPISLATGRSGWSFNSSPSDHDLPEAGKDSFQLWVEETWLRASKVYQCRWPIRRCTFPNPNPTFLNEDEEA